jgi:hypothetical protein
VGHEDERHGGDRRRMSAAAGAFPLRGRGSSYSSRAAGRRHFASTGTLREVLVGDFASSTVSTPLS